MGLMSEQTNKTKNTEQTEQTARVVRGVIAREKGAPVELTDICIPSPGPNDVIVDIQACGVCHTDLAYRDGDITDEYPFFLGHEAAGVVSEIGEEVTHVAVGDFVVLNWRAVCGECRACKRGEPQYCFSTFNASKPMTLADGTVLTPALGIGAFADATSSTRASAPRSIRQPIRPLRACWAAVSWPASVRLLTPARSSAVNR